MAATRIFRHAKHLRQARSGLRNDHATFIRWFASDARPAVDKMDYISRSNQLDIGSGGKLGFSKFSTRDFSSRVHMVPLVQNG